MFMRQQYELLRSAPADDPSINQANFFSCGAALALVAWDTLLTLNDEAHHIWSGPGRWHVKWIYLFSRWFGLLTQICFHIWLYFLAAHTPTPVSTCEAFFIFEAVSFQSLLLCLDAILILRICAIHQQRRCCIILALAIVFFEVTMSVITQALSIPKSTVGGTCAILHTPITTLCLAIGMVVSQTVLLALTYRGNVHLHPAARGSKLIAIVVRDATLVFVVAIGVVLAMAFLYVLLNQVFINFFWPWMLVLPSILTPRIILNMQMAAEPTESMLEFTTNLDATPNYNEITQFSECA